MRKKQTLLKQISFRLYDNDRDRQIYEFLEGLEENQSIFIKAAVEQQIRLLKGLDISDETKELNKSPEITQKQDLIKEKESNQDNESQTDKSPRKRFLGGFNGFEG